MANQLDRQSDGRFAKGNPGGPGNPFARQVAKLRQVLLESVTEEDLREIVQAMVKKAKEGDMVAAREVLSRVIGKPAEAPDPDRLDVEKAKLKSENLVSALFGGAD
jgi:hypothetical protein